MLKGARALFRKLFGSIFISHVISLLCLYYVICLANRKYETQLCEEFTIEVINPAMSLLDDEQLLHYVQLQYTTSNFLHKPLASFIATQLVQKLCNTRQIKKAAVYKTWKGKLRITVQAQVPIARVFCINGKDGYLTREGEFFPAFGKKARRLPLITPVLESFLADPKYKINFMSLLRFINEDSFLKAQFPHVHVLSNGDLLFYPQVTKAKIEFGKPVDIKQKFDKLVLFYRKVLPYKGWNAYKRINLQFNNQIVCE